MAGGRTLWYPFHLAGIRPATRSPNLTGPRRSPMRVLFIEDSPRLQQSVGTGLRKAGFAVDVAADGEEGLWMAESNDYDVLVLDLMLPKLDGLALLQRLRSQ